MAEVIDYLFFFWVFVTGAVYALGSFYEKHARDRLKLKQNHETRAGKQAKHDSWPDLWGPMQQRQDLGHSYSSYNSPQSVGPGSSERQVDHSSQTFANDLNSANYSTQSRLLSHATNSVHDQCEQTSPRYQHDYNTAHDSRSASETAAAYLQQDSPLQTRGPRATEGSIPTATGFNANSVEWVNNILLLFYSQSDKYGPIIIESVYRSLNEKLSNIKGSCGELSNLVVEFSGVDKQLTTKPELTNIRTESESEKSVSIVCKIYNRRIVFNLTIKRETKFSYSSSLNQSAIARGTSITDDDDSLHYELVLENLEGKLKSVAMLNDKLIVVQFLEKPDTKILLKPKLAQLNRVHQSSLHVNEDNLVSVILQTLTQVVVDLYFGDDVDFPQYRNSLSNQPAYKNTFNILKGNASEFKRQIKQDFFGALSSSSDNKERKIFVGLLGAKNINYNQNVTCLLELDAPYQQALSSTKQGSNPFWDEHFRFNITEKSEELLLELWDSISPNFAQEGTQKRLTTRQSSPGSQTKWSKAELTSIGKFLGSARVSIEDLKRNPVQKRSLALLPKQPIGLFSGDSGSLAMASDLSNSVGGELQVELLFLEHSNSLQKSGSTSSSISYQLGDVVSVDRKLTPSGYVITTTTITKPTNQQQQCQAAERQRRFDQLSVRNQSPNSSTAEQSEIDLNLDGVSSQAGEAQSEQRQPDSGSRSRSRSRSRSFLRAIRKRFSFSRTRSRSVGGESAAAGSGLRKGSQSALSSNLDRVSIESRSRASSEVSNDRAKSVPANRDLSEVPTIVINKGRLSDTESAFTFTHPKSQLVIECTEPMLRADGSTIQKGQLRYYAVSDDAANKAKWRKRGLKLHVFNEHQFVACHLAGSSVCHLCGRVFSRRPGKQGYRCRNCHLLSHKQCHVKVDHNCPYASKDGLKLEYIDADPPANLIDSLRGTHSARRKQMNRPARLDAKSVSMEADDR